MLKNSVNKVGHVRLDRQKFKCERLRPRTSLLHASTSGSEVTHEYVFKVVREKWKIKYIIRPNENQDLIIDNVWKQRTWKKQRIRV